MLITYTTMPWTCHSPSLPVLSDEFGMVCEASYWPTHTCCSLLFAKKQQDLDESDLPLHNNVNL